MVIYKYQNHSQQSRFIYVETSKAQEINKIKENDSKINEAVVLKRRERITGFDLHDIHWLLKKPTLHQEHG